MTMNRAKRPYPPVNVLFNGLNAPASFVNLSPIGVTFSRRDRLKNTVSFPSDPDETPEAGTTYVIRHGPPDPLLKTETTLVSGGTFNFAYQGVNEIEVFAKLAGLESRALTFGTTAENGTNISVAGAVGEVGSAITFTAPVAETEVGFFGGIGTITMTPPEATGGVGAIAAGDIGTVTATSPEGAASIPASVLATPMWGTNPRLANAFNFSQANVTRFFQAAGQFAFLDSGAVHTYTSEGTWRREVGESGTISNFAMNIQSNARTTATEFTLRVNGVDTTQTVTIGAGISGTVVTGGAAVAVSQGDLLSIKMVTSSGGQNMVIAASEMAFEGNSATVIHHYMQGDTGLNQNVNTTLGAPFHGTAEGNTFGLSYDTSPTAAEDYDCNIYTGGTVRRLRIFLTVNTLNVDMVFRLFVNGVGTSLLITVPAGQTGIFENNADTVTVSPTDRLHYRQVVGAGTGGYRVSWAQAIISRSVAAYDVMIAARASDTLQNYNSARHFIGVGGLVFPASTDDSTLSFSRHATRVAGLLGNMWVRYNHSGAGAAYDYTLRKNGTDTAVFVTGPASTGSGVVQNNTDTVSIAAGDRLSVGFQTAVFAQTPTAWGFTVSA